MTLYIVPCVLTDNCKITILTALSDKRDFLFVDQPVAIDPGAPPVVSATAPYLFKRVDVLATDSSGVSRPVISAWFCGYLTYVRIPQARRECKTLKECVVLKKLLLELWGFKRGRPTHILQGFARHAVLSLPCLDKSSILAMWNLSGTRKRAKQTLPNTALAL